MKQPIVPFSRSQDAAAAKVKGRPIHVIELRSLSYHFNTHFHPYVQQLVEALNEDSVAGLEAQDTRPDHVVDDFKVMYSPDSATFAPYPKMDIDFEGGGAYAVYNWELFYHVPMTVAIHLSRNGRYAEAMQWFHYVFDPTCDSDEALPGRFWQVKPFKVADVTKIEELLTHLSAAPATDQLRIDLLNSIAKWRANPFRPHLVARIRQTPYMHKAVMSYLDNLIDWGDSLFRQDTGETINEATQLYVMAANILGARPQAWPRKGWQQPQSYAQLKQAGLDGFGNALIDIEADIPFDLAPPGTAPVAYGEHGTLRSIGRTLYFAVPRNDKLLGYWDTVADRLFKIRNSLNLAGIFRQLPLFEPPIDPALLARAAAAGLDIGAVVAGLNQPLPLVRFGLLAGKAAEICQEVKSLGGHLLAAIEKHDNEKLSLLRTSHEKAILGLAESVKYSQWQESIKAREGLEQSLANAFARYTHYERQLGKAEKDITLPQLDALDAAALAALRFSSTEPAVVPRDLDIDIAAGLGASGGKIVSSHEKSELNALGDAHTAGIVAKVFEVIRTGVVMIPQFEASMKPIGVGAATGFGGRQLAGMAEGYAAVARAVGDRFSYQASRSARIGGFARRELEWGFQSNNAAGEITQIFKQLRAAQIREAITERELANHRQQMENAAQIEEFLSDKSTNAGFYAYLKREVRRLYSQCFDLAHEAAKKAERALRHELGDQSLTFLGTSYLSGKEGLLAGEKLYLDIKRMELAYHDLNRREYELTTHVSLRKLDPAVLLTLRATGRCVITVPEDWFDLDCPGHYFRRIKSVAVSIPCVAGPYATVNCTLTQLKSTIRKTPALGGSYARDGDDTERFDDHFGSLQSIVTSTAVNDSGMFDTNLRDERYLPFEGTGAISQWQLDLPADLPQFDHTTITDVVLHLRYTAREGGEPLRAEAAKDLKAKVDAGQAAGSVRLLSVRQEFPSEWATLKTTSALTVQLRDEHYPHWAKKVPSIEIKQFDLYAAGSSFTVAGSDPSTELGGLHLTTLSTPPEPIGEFTMTFDSNTMTDLWLAFTWGSR